MIRINQHLEATSKPRNVWSRIAKELNSTCEVKETIAYWKQCSERFVRQLRARKELIDHLRSTYGTSPLSLTTFQEHFLNTTQASAQNRNKNIESNCRICLASPESSEMLYLFNGNALNNDENSLLDKLIFCCCLKIEPCVNDNFPKYICIECSTLLENAYQFKILCAQTDDRLEKMLSQQDESEEESEDYNLNELRKCNVIEYV